jgi:hypothetical protein
LKNQGYNLEHNYDLGKKHLSTVFAHLMLLAFLVDQVQQPCCPLFQAAEKAGGAMGIRLFKLSSFQRSGPSGNYPEGWPEWWVKIPVCSPKILCFSPYYFKIRPEGCTNDADSLNFHGHMHG